VGPDVVDWVGDNFVDPCEPVRLSDAMVSGSNGSAGSQASAVANNSGFANVVTVSGTDVRAQHA